MCDVLRDSSANLLVTVLLLLLLIIPVRCWRHRETLVKHLQKRLIGERISVILNMKKNTVKIKNNTEQEPLLSLIISNDVNEKPNWELGETVNFVPKTPECKAAVQCNCIVFSLDSYLFKQSVQMWWKCQAD